ncbi:ribosome biogenesis GTP-binding protein YsxC [Enterobacteriaceae endosymbiont of Donacia thalassina]|uniref:ribosome biogenesis GTP-binding protein YihA/YsxC n=1 Tax=Enterobacteriaceae endosymbiont of Donacia thalassina TaxID=2675786 RepID=UPI001449677A|nr:ribosome biogenesis GTP-binding protein YihA/YsxC [Enterobacteriaceae endosymbiont of Donacia thalassina]QJC37482.1 ribosome biogenesis GTP-binding protein YsxC [Enterobacteriaceae endosymbiont of Donacia thalassina]
MNNFNNINFSYSTLNIKFLITNFSSQVQDIAFIGYSNVGKSSMINILLNKKIAYVSKTPGSTLYINVFENNKKKIRFLDFPGYGYNKFIIKNKLKYFYILQKYLNQKNSLKGIILLIDIRSLLKEKDIKILKKLIFYKKPILLILNKIDKISKKNIKNNINKIIEILKKKIDIFFDKKIILLTFSIINKKNLIKIKKIINYWL